MNKVHFLIRSSVAAAWVFAFVAHLTAADWPQWRFDASRSAASPEQLPAELALQWTREFEPRKQAWDDPLNLDLMTYDRVFEPIVAGGRMFLAFNDRDKVVAYDLETGRELWTFFTQGPVRLPPAVWNDHLFVASDDGHLYCVKVATGELAWKFRGGPGPRQILGNQRVVSAWPMRGGPVVRDGKVYVAASIWPFMGTFIYALDAATGDVVWVNDETGAQYIKQPHSAPSFAGVAPQGALVATENTLLVPGGRSVPAAFDRHTGKFKYFELNAGGKGTGGSFLAANEQSWFVHTRLRGTREFSLDTGVKTAFQPNEPVLAGDRIYTAAFEKDRATVQAFSAGNKNLLWETPADGRGDLILAGDHLYAASAKAENGQSTICSIRLPAEKASAAIEWTAAVPGAVERLVAANGKLIAVTLEGRIYSFGAGTSGSDKVIEESSAKLAVDPPAAARVKALLAAGQAEGFATWLGDSSSPDVTALAAVSPFVELTIVEENEARAAASRKRFDAALLPGRVAVHQSTLAELLPPPYVANMLFVDATVTARLASDEALITKLYESVRPYGGAMCLVADEKQVASLKDRLASLSLPNAELQQTEFGLVVRRVGPLPGAGSWTHQYGDMANSLKSDDTRVKLPLGVLWFGGVTHNDVLPRHGHGPPEQVIGGRLIIQGTNSLTARDVYTGRVLWRRTFNDLGTYDVFFDETYKETPLDPAYNQVHIPGANGRGTNYVATADRVYIIEGAVCHVLDSATGKDLQDIALPQTDPAQPVDWGYIGVYDNILLAGNGFAKYRQRLGVPDDPTLAPKRAAFGPKSLDRAASMGLVAFDRITGRQLWKVDAHCSFWHNGICAGSGLIYALDRHPKPVEEFLARRGQSEADRYRIAAFDLRTGSQVWELPGKVFGTWLSYSDKHDLLLQAGAAASDRLSSEVSQGMAVYRGQTGETVWTKDLKYSGPCVLHNDLIITNANSYSESAGALRLVDGEEKKVPHPLTGEPQPWRITRAYGCNSIIASENLLTFRSGAAGFYDLLTEGGTGNLGGFRSGCTSNLVVADGVLNAPDYTRTCSCSYQNQTSLALVNMPEVDAWTISNTAQLPTDQKARHLGLNFGAPGDRRDQHGLMWLAYPPAIEQAPNFNVTLTGTASFFQDHSSTKVASTLPWVASSGVQELESLQFHLKPTANSEEKPQARARAKGDCADETTPTANGDSLATDPYRVRLHFGLPRGSAREQRVFDVEINGTVVVRDVTLGGAAPDHAVRTADRVLIGDRIEIRFLPKAGTPLLSGIELHRLDD